MRYFKAILKWIAIIITICVILFTIFLAYLMITDYRPKEITNVATENPVTSTILETNKDINIVTWNIGYAGLGVSEDFFLDGGTKGKPDSKDVVTEYLDGIVNRVKNEDFNILMLQEVDLNSDRSFNINEYELLKEQFTTYNSAFAYNYKVKFVPVPLPPIGKVEAGQATFSNFVVSKSERYSLPGVYPWPKQLVMLDRSLLVSRMPVGGTDKELVLINAHFEAYDNGSIRTKQMAYVKELINKEYEKGNYVIVGGDWNQTFDFIDVSQFPMYKNGEFYNPYPIPSEWLLTGWKWGVGTNAPTYRLLNEPYQEGKTQIGIIDGFLVSPNIKINQVEVLDEGFKYSDHNPVKISLQLLP